MAISARVVTYSQSGTDAAQRPGGLPQKGTAMWIVDGIDLTKVGAAKMFRTDNRLFIVMQVYAVMTSLSGYVSQASATVGTTAPSYNDISGAVGLDASPYVGETSYGHFESLLLQSIPPNSDVYFYIADDGSSATVADEETLTLVVNGIYL